MVGADDPSVAAGQHALLLSLSTRTAAEALACSRRFTAKLRSLTSGITTTAKRSRSPLGAELPLSFQNDTKRAGIRVRVHLDSPKLIFPDGPDIRICGCRSVITPRRSRSRRASGTFTMTVTLESADGSVELGPPTRVTIRSGGVQRDRDRRSRSARCCSSRVGGATTSGGRAVRGAPHPRRERVEHSRGRSRASRPLERGGRDGHAPLARHRALARRGPRVRGRARQPRRHLQPRQLDAQHRLRAPARRCAVGHARTALRRAPRTATTRDVGRLHRRVDGAHRVDRDRDAVRSAHRTPTRSTRREPSAPRNST